MRAKARQGASPKEGRGKGPKVGPAARLCGIEPRPFGPGFRRWTRGGGVSTKPPAFGFKPSSAQVAQLVEQRTENPRVGSSILSLGTIQLSGSGFFVA